MSKWDWVEVRIIVVSVAGILCVAHLLVACIHECQATERAKFAAGYVQSFVPTTVGPVWTKPSAEGK